MEQQQQQQQHEEEDDQHSSPAWVAPRALQLIRQGQLDDARNLLWNDSNNNTSIKQGPLADAFQDLRCAVVFAFLRAGRVEEAHQQLRGMVLEQGDAPTLIVDLVQTLVAALAQAQRWQDALFWVLTLREPNHLWYSHDMEQVLGQLCQQWSLLDRKSSLETSNHDTTAVMTGDTNKHAPQDRINLPCQDGGDRLLWWQPTTTRKFSRKDLGLPNPAVE